MSYGLSRVCARRLASKPGEGNLDSRRDQVTFYRERVDPEEEITRPRGYPGFVQWLIRSKLEAALDLFSAAPRREEKVFVLCCGSGLDLDILSERGVALIGLDLSRDAITRARERGRRFGLRYELVCGDAAALPFRQSAFDVAFVHDGLHHLEDPYVGVAEMVRVSRRGVVIAEPATALLTRIAVWIGLSKDYEEVGNFVNRLSPAELTNALRLSGLTNVRMLRELCYYQPWTYRVYALMERILGLSVMKRLYSWVNVIVGRWGNSLRAAAWR